MCIIIIVCKREREGEGGRERERKREKPIILLFLPIGHIGLAIVLSFEWGHP